MKKRKIEVVHVYLSVAAILFAAFLHAVSITWSMAGEFRATKDAIYENQQQIKSLNKKDNRRALRENYEEIMALESLYLDDYFQFKGEAHMSPKHRLKLEDLRIIRQSIRKDLGLD